MRLVEKIKFAIPFVILFALFALLYKELFYAKPNELPSALIGRKIPQFDLPQLTKSSARFTSKDLLGQVSLLNIWASWCFACEKEQALLMRISRDYHIPIYAINYKDKTEAAATWLKQFGNPYVMIGADKNGDTAIDLGVYGTPETFIIGRKGQIVYRHIGVIDKKTWDEVLLPLIKTEAGK